MQRYKGHMQLVMNASNLKCFKSWKMTINDDLADNSLKLLFPGLLSLKR